MTPSLKEKAKKLKNNLDLIRTLRLIWSVTEGRVVGTLLLVVLENLLFLVSLYIFKRLVNTIAVPNTAGGKAADVMYYLFAAALLTVAYVVAKSITGLFSEMQAAKISAYVDDKIHAAAIDLDYAFYESPAYFDTIKRAKDAGPDRPNAIFTNLINITKNSLMLLVLGSVMVSINWMLLPLLALFVLPTLMVRISFSKRLYQWQMEQTPLERKSTYLGGLITEEGAAKEIKAFGLGPYLRNLYMKIRMDLLSQRIKITKRSTLQESITTVLATLGLFACISLICRDAVNGEASVGDVTLFLFVFPQLFSMMQAVANGISSLYQNQIFLSHLFELFDLKSKLTQPEETLPIPAGKNVDLEIANLTFQYVGAKAPTLSDVSLKVPAGKIVALVGLNGAGKTTLIKLLCRLYDPTFGQIRLGGTDIRAFNLSDYRKQVSVVFQDFCRYNVSAADNIRFGDIERVGSPNEIMEAAIKSGAHDYISQFPDGYDTIMGRIFEDGREVSIGQWQKLAIARSFYSQAGFLIFDEATSALDAKAEHELFESFRERIGDRGILVISHRLSAVKHADYIYVMAEGKVRQEGTHEELLAAPGEFSRLFKKKASPAVS